MKTFFKKIIVAILFFEAKLVLAKYRPKIVAVTGSVGKTSAKDAIYAVLAQFYYVRKSEKSFNSEIGLPLTILGLHNAWNNPLAWIQNIVQGAWLVIHPAKKYPEWLVLEAGVGKPGDMKDIAKLIKTDVVVFTEFSKNPVHVEFFEGSTDAVLKEKALLITSLKKDGILLLNRDNEMIMSLKENAKHITYTYGMDANADVSISNDSISYERDGIPSGVNFRINYEGNSLPVHLEGVFGRNHIYSALIALAVTHVEKLNMLQAIEALKDYEIAPGRMRLLEGEKGTYIIDDTYNASPIAMQAALHTLGDMKVKGRKIAVLGDMLELGRLTEESHKEIGALAQQSADVLVVVGKRANHIAEGAIEAGYSEERIFKFDTADQAKTEIEQMIREGDIILVKGSQGMRMEKIVEEIMAHPELKEKLLVRQEVEWRNR